MYRVSPELRALKSEIFNKLDELQTDGRVAAAVKNNQSPIRLVTSLWKEKVCNRTAYAWLNTWATSRGVDVQTLRGRHVLEGKGKLKTEVKEAKLQQPVIELTYEHIIKAVPNEEALGELLMLGYGKVLHEKADLTKQLEASQVETQDWKEKYESVLEDRKRIFHELNHYISLGKKVKLHELKALVR